MLPSDYEANYSKYVVYHRFALGLVHFRMRLDILLNPVKFSRCVELPVFRHIVRCVAIYLYYTELHIVVRSRWIGQLAGRPPVSRWNLQWLSAVAYGGGPGVDTTGGTLGPAFLELPQTCKKMLSTFGPITCNGNTYRFQLAQLSGAAFWVTMAEVNKVIYEMDITYLNAAPLRLPCSTDGTLLLDSFPWKLSGLQQVTNWVVSSGNYANDPVMLKAAAIWCEK